MKMCKTISTFILLFTGYFGKNMHVAAAEPGNGTQSVLEESHTSEVTVAPESETATSGSNHVPEKRVSSTYVAGLSISGVILSICVITGVWYKQRLSKGSSAEINSVPSSEASVTLKNIKT